MRAPLFAIFAAGCVFAPPSANVPATTMDAAVEDAGELIKDAALDASDAGDVGPNDTGDLLDAEPDDNGFEDASSTDADDPDAGLVPDCGDRRIELPETCDDGNVAANDGCDPSCQVEEDFLCAGLPSRCVLQDEAAVVDAAGPSCPGSSGNGTADDPYCLIDTGLGASRPFVIVRSGLYPEQIVIGGETVEIIADPGAILEHSEIPLTIESSADVTVRGLHLRSTGADALKIHQGGTVASIYACIIGPSNGLGADVKNGTTVTFEGNVVESNPLGGLLIDTPTHRLVNNSVRVNGPGAEFGGVYLKRGPGVFVNNTVADNLAVVANGSQAGVRCDVAATPIINSIIWDNRSGGTTSSLSPQCTPTYSDIGPGPGGSGTNVDVDPLFSAEGTYHLSPASPLIGAGHPAGVESAGGPAPNVDIDGELRPIGGRVDVGADEAG